MPMPLRSKTPGEDESLVPSRAPLGQVHSVETFGLVDGPGVRYVVIMQGCRMRCQYCHNPETWDTKAGAECSAEDLFNKAWRYHNYWSNNGGVTVGGGEPLLQIEFVTGFFEILKEHGVHTALDTAGGPFSRDPVWLQKLDKLLSVTDLVLLDLKAWDSSVHKELTGWPNGHIKDMARYISESGTKMWIRRVLVPGVTDAEDDLRNTGGFIASLSGVERVEILPYNMMAQLKWEEQDLPYPLPKVLEPTAEQVSHAESILGAG